MILEPATVLAFVATTLSELKRAKKEHFESSELNGKQKKRYEYKKKYG